ncbi:uncharacterized protein LOC18427225 isoform X2 [Amborella trichopoda]|uniref:SAM-dependent MTase RsmB/NOP-type domain-containing protein n=1 Tax=Amborella trichopoda TaxID=13333 RepID=W1NVD6_AMBTC|nr:uncharacterized protein LOC18427225 isoform X2 [Amborella trichopoda]ERM99195.1 hypothetical protein AMTR_s00092p00091040 [Amborella trichopoda]|eukprot:XP_006836342.1 uncharacterized protein LOC18427225 isoform X2 [Amborella trichopoda]
MEILNNIGDLLSDTKNIHIKNGTVNLPLPDAYLDFLKRNGLDPSIYDDLESLPRYVRLKPGVESQLGEIEAEIGRRLEKVVWLPGFFALPPHIHIASSNPYRQGKLYGMDAASGAAVAALNIVPGDHVLDLCAAPGAKLCMILDLLSSSGSLTGVDIARHRLAACRTMLQKYGLGDHCRLFVADGTSFCLLPLRTCVDLKSNSECALDKKKALGGSTCDKTSDVYMEWKPRRHQKVSKNANKARAGGASTFDPIKVEPELIYYGKNSGLIGLKKSELFRSYCEDKAFEFGYDKVLVDAECTHDGSLKHIHKFEQWGWETLQRRVLDAQRTTSSITLLQLQLLTNGYRLLKVGGVLVYSTCSLTIAQNEDVVEQFLSENPSAELQEIHDSKHWPCSSGGIMKTLRFNPRTSRTSGLFVAKIMKKIDI